MIPPQWLPVLLAGHTQRFLVLTMQHSGSTLFDVELNAQRGVACAGELLRDLDEHLLPRNGSHQVQAPPWEEWVARADAAFERVHEEEVVTLKSMPRNRTDAVGFKLMYSQIWDNPNLT